MTDVSLILALLAVVYLWGRRIAGATAGLVFGYSLAPLLLGPFGYPSCTLYPQALGSALLGYLTVRLTQRPGDRRDVIMHRPHRYEGPGEHAAERAEDQPEEQPQRDLAIRHRQHLGERRALARAGQRRVRVLAQVDLGDQHHGRVRTGLGQLVLGLKRVEMGALHGQRRA